MTTKLSPSMKDLVEKKKMQRQAKLTDGVDGLLLLRVTINHGPKSEDCILLGWVSRLGLGFLQVHLILSDYIYPKCVPKCHSYNIAWECFHIEFSE